MSRKRSTLIDSPLYVIFLVAVFFALLGGLSALAGYYLSQEILGEPTGPFVSGAISALTIFIFSLYVSKD